VEGVSKLEFIICRIIFLLTYLRGPNPDECSIDWPAIIRNKGLGSILNQKLEKYSKLFASKTYRANPGQFSIGSQSVNEMATLIFNLAHFNQSIRSIFEPSIGSLFSILTTKSILAPLNQPYSSIVNALLGLDETASVWHKEAFPRSDPTKHVASLISGIKPTIISLPLARQDIQLPPLFSLVQKLLTSAPTPVVDFMKKRLLPSNEDRKQVLGKTDSVASQLIRTTMSASTPAAANSASLLLWALSGESSDTLVREVGFGVASGILVKMGIPLPSGVEELPNDSLEINPVTGQRRDMEDQKELAEMTEEEKEQEAERLFVLFDRLNRTGVIKVENPIRKAMEEGKLEEVKDDN
jgi:hypothetical protein